jgi:hypothetical protein
MMEGAVRDISFSNFTDFVPNAKANSSRKNKTKPGSIPS